MPETPSCCRSSGEANQKQSQLGLHLASRDSREAISAIYNYSPNYFGADVYPLTPRFARQDNLSITYGAVVSRVNAEGSAARVGLVPGDVITAVNNTPIHDSLDLEVAIAAIPAYADVPISYVRPNQTLYTTHVTITSDPYRATQLFMF